jgi:hypothetical protein
MGGSYILVIMMGYYLFLFSGLSRIEIPKDVKLPEIFFLFVECSTRHLLRR